MSITNKSLAVKYRPRKLKDLVGQEHVVSKLRGMFKSKELPGAILLSGPTGTGKTTVSQLIARYLFCATTDACGKCPNCLVPVDRHPDYEQMNASDTRGIDDIRMLIRRAQNKPRQAPMRIVLLDECHQLTPQAAEALLLPLENPPEQTLYILSTTNPENLKQTIRNRCLTLPLNLVPREVVGERLKYIAGKEDIKVSKKLVERITDLSGGYMRDAISLLESVQKVLADNKKADDETILRIVNQDAQESGAEGMDELVMKLLIALYALNLKGLCTFATDLSGNWVDVISQCIRLTQFLVDSSLHTKHRNVWWTPLNKRFSTAVKSHSKLKELGFDAQKKLPQLISLLQVLTDLRKTLISGGVAGVERSVITSALGGWITIHKQQMRKAKE